MVVMTNAERSSATRGALLDATIEALVKYGYHGATSTRIAEISGLTRGAQMHHFKTKAGLVAAALLHIHAKRIEIFQEMAQANGNNFSLEALIEQVWASFNDDVWLAAAELWTAARTDEELRAALVPAERTISKRIRDQLAPTLANGYAGSRLQALPPRRMTAIVGLIYSAMRGMALHEAFDPDEKRAKAQRTELVRALTALIGAEGQKVQSSRQGSARRSR
ncbi:TetR/AcrR family transcriptional regulator [Mycobacterium genavense]|uniref:TetR/AcrR family transcriptional regulator n=1 Tax=Mycobacterium genavense TaxID=36812 RepID=UPI00046EFD4C|nr:TetR/AcrR family transcriptional regulator [Mycobacterium genavense]